MLWEDIAAGRLLPALVAALPVLAVPSAASIESVIDVSAAAMPARAAFRLR
jgi:hypothetical protein